MKAIFKCPGSKWRMANVIVLKEWKEEKMIDEKKLIDELKQSGMIADNEYGNAMVDFIKSQPQVGERLPGKYREQMERLTNRRTKKRR